MLNAKASCRFRKKAKIELITPPIMATFIPEAAITCITPEIRRLSLKSSGKGSFMPNTTPKRKLEYGAGKDFEKVAMILCRKELTIPKPGSFFTAFIFGKYIDEKVLLLPISL